MCWVFRVHVLFLQNNCQESGGTFQELKAEASQTPRSAQCGGHKEGGSRQPHWDPLAEVPAFPWLASYNSGCFPSSRVLAVAVDDKVEHKPSISLCPSSTDLLKGMSLLLIKWPTQYLLKWLVSTVNLRTHVKLFPLKWKKLKRVKCGNTDKRYSAKV